MIDQSIQLMLQTIFRQPVACAHITGSSQIHNLVGDVYLYPFLEGSLLVVDVEGIPFSGFYGFHIHQHGPCVAGEGYTGFHDVGGHFTTTENAPHPYHAGDLPVLMAYYGHAFMIVYTDRFRPQEVLGRAMIIHEWPDDFRTQPTGDSGQPIGCGTFYPCTGYLSALPGAPGTEPIPGIPPSPMPGTDTERQAPMWQPGAGTPPSEIPPTEELQPSQPPSGAPAEPGTAPQTPPSGAPAEPGAAPQTPPSGAPPGNIPFIPEEIVPTQPI